MNNGYFRIIVLMLLLPVSCVSQNNYRYISKYHLLEIRFVKEPYKINIVRLALVPKNNRNLSVAAIKKELQTKNDISTLSLSSDFSVYNFIPKYSDSYLYPRNDASDGDGATATDTTAKTKFYYWYLEMLKNSKPHTLTDESTYLTNDSMLIKITEVKGKMLLVNYETGADILSRNRTIKDNYKTRVASLSSDSANFPAANGKEYIVSDVFLPFPGKFLLQGGEDSVNLRMSSNLGNKNIRYRNKDFITRSQLLKK